MEDKLRVCILYESRLGRNDGPPLYWNNALQNLGVEVVHLSSQNHFAGSKFDHILWVDWGEDALTGALPYEPISMSNYDNTVYIASDTHLGFDYRVNKAKEFKRVFVNQADAVQLFSNKGVVAEWLPHAVEPKAFPDSPPCIKKYDVGFVGYVTFHKRAVFLDRMFKEFPEFYYGQHLFEECAEKFRQSKVVLNTSATDDLNMRFFECWATGSFLMSEYIPSMEFMDCPVDPSLYTYANLDHCVERIKYYLDNVEERENITDVMKQWVLQNHTYQERAKKIFNIPNKEIENVEEQHAINN